jgi:hypothetical protein
MHKHGRAHGQTNKQVHTDTHTRFSMYFDIKFTTSVFNRTGNELIFSSRRSTCRDLIYIPI